MDPQDREARSLPEDPMLAALLALVVAAPAAEVLGLDDTGGPALADGPEALVWGGRTAPGTDLDAVVALQLGGRGHAPAHTFCSGALVDASWVLTAAHCLRDLDAWRRDGWLPSVAVGPEAERQRVGVDRTVVHPGYDPEAGPGHSVDLALVHLASPVTGVTPLRPTRTTLDVGYVGLPVSVVGYGVTASDAEEGGVRRAADLFLAGVQGGFVRLFDGTTAWDDVEQDYDELVWDSTANACFGDSGGPALVRSGGTWAVVGVVSVVYPTCEHGATGALRVDDQLAWLGEHVPLRGTVPLPPPPGLHGDDDWPDPVPVEATSSGAPTDQALLGCDQRGGSGPVGWAALVALAGLGRRRRADAGVNPRT